MTQLTRIIYLLNAKNEENRAIVDSVLEANSEENSKTVSKLLNEIKLLKEKNKEIINSYENKYNDFIREIRKEFEMKKREFENKINEIKNGKESISDEINNNFNIKIAAMNQQLMNNKKD